VAVAVAVAVAVIAEVEVVTTMEETSRLKRATHWTTGCREMA
jgi:hypothetical protein